MMTSGTTQSKLKQLYQKKRPYFFAAFVCLLLYSFSFIPILPSGIDQPSAIGTYLNGAFPNDAPAGTGENWVVENAYPHLTFSDPVAMLEVPNENSNYVIGKVGIIWQVANDSATTVKDTVLDILSMVDTDIDAGVVNAILHPEFGQAGSPNRGYIYVFYRWHPSGNVSGCGTFSFLRLSRFNRPDGSNEFDPNSEFVIVQTFDEHCWHNGGGMFFDNDGYFYYTTGDAGEINDPYETTQKLDERLTSGLFRIDLTMDPTRSHPIRRQQVDPAYIPFPNDSSFAQGYYIPNDNPWQNQNGTVLEEYYSLGLRSPHRATMDTLTGHVWFGDVGQGAREEISVVTAPGQNFQWPFMEGNKPGDFSEPDQLIGVSTPPIYDYDHSVGNSIIGGFVYRGSYYQGALNGRYIFGDHGTRNVWTYNPDNGEVLFLVNVPDFGQGDKNGISSFATNSSGEVFVLKLYGTDLDGGVIYKLKQESTVPEPPALLSQTGAFSDLATLTPATGIIPYTVNAPLWSDRAEKQRWIAVPNNGTHNTADEQITFSENGNWQFPAGTVFIKHFELPVDYNNPSVTKRLETRFFVMTDDGGGYGVTYKWNDAGTDAELLVNSDTKDFTVTLPGGGTTTQTWEYPSRTNCMTCHNANSDFVLGVHTWQLNGDLTYPSSGITDNQLNTWNHLGMFANPFNPANIPTFPKAAYIGDTSATLATRVRSYLDSNCSHCHQPNGVDGAFDARFTTPLENQNILWKPGQSRNTPTDHYIIKPLDVSESELWIRDGSLGTLAMPPLAKSLVHDEYMAVLTEWIGSLEDEACIEVPLTTLEWEEGINGNGPIELNLSNGEEQIGDGFPITINGNVYPLGLGVHALSEITYLTNADYSIFESFVGVDDSVEPCGDAAVQFEVYADDVLVAQSPVLTWQDEPYLMKVDIIGANKVKLVVNNGGNGYSCDHGDWANPRFITCAECVFDGPCDDGDPCTINDKFDINCDCIGVSQDSDLDTVADGCDVCPGYDDALDIDLDGVPDGCDTCLEFDDNLDTDLDGVPDGCDLCWQQDDRLDADLDGVPDGCDICWGYDDNLDADADGVPDGCDLCPGYDDKTDNDLDGVPDGCDLCPGYDDTLDIDLDGVPDGCDLCPDYDDTLDTDLDTVADGCDICPGYDDTLDTDLDGVPDGCDLCPGFDDAFDADLDGVPDGCDLCPGYDDTLDTDLDTVADGCDVCPGFDDTLDSDLDNVPDDCDICPGFDDNLDIDLDGVPDGCDLCPGFDDTIDNNNNNIPDACEDCSLTQGQPCDDGNLCTINDVYDATCNCVGTPVTADADGDGVCDAADQCPGYDDTIDTDNDNIPDACDPCVGLTGLPCDDGNACTINDLYDQNCDCVGTLTGDSDGDSVCDALDQCPGFDDTLDTDLDGVPDNCDLCPGFDDTIDTDNDNIPDSCDSCIGMYGPGCPGGDCAIDGNPIPSDTYSASQRITSVGKVMPDSNVVFQAGNTIELKAGFKIEAGGSFHATIVECENPSSRTAEAGEELPAFDKPSLEVLTNPISSKAILKYKIEQEGLISIRMIDVTGLLVATPLESAYRKVGEYELHFDADLPAGIYYAQLQYEDGTVQDKLVLTNKVETNETPDLVKELNEQKELDVSIRPNPFRTAFKLYIKSPLPQMKRATIRVMDTSGRVIYQKYDTPFNEEITIRAHDGWVNGVYLIHIHASNYRFTHTLVKQ